MSDTSLTLAPADLDDPRIVALLQTHATTARAQTAPGSAHALDLAAFRAGDIALWAAWSGDALVGVGALKTHSRDLGEIKSMHVAVDARGRGAGGAILAHLVGEARKAGLARVSLETGAWPYFEPARALYRRHGFVDCAPFAGYVDDPNSCFMTRALIEGAS